MEERDFIFCLFLGGEGRRLTPSTTWGWHSPAIDFPVHSHETEDTEVGNEGPPYLRKDSMQAAWWEVGVAKWEEITEK